MTMVLDGQRNGFDAGSGDGGASSVKDAILLIPALTLRSCVCFSREQLAELSLSRLEVRALERDPQDKEIRCVQERDRVYP